MTSQQTDKPTAGQPDGARDPHARVRLEDLSLDELWELFPITLVEPKDAWSRQYRRMEAVLETALAGTAGLRISHVGSTAIKGIKAKDVVDVLVEVDPQEPLASLAQRLTRLGFIQMAETPTRISLNHGYTPHGYAEEVFHVHLRHKGDNDELYFRDYLNGHEDVAREYESLKITLLATHGRDRDAYTDAKADFVRTWSAAGRAAHEGRY